MMRAVAAGLMEGRRSGLLVMVEMPMREERRVVPREKVSDFHHWSTSSRPRSLRAGAPALA